METVAALIVLFRNSCCKEGENSVAYIRKLFDKCLLFCTSISLNRDVAAVIQVFIVQLVIILSLNM